MQLIFESPFRDEGSEEDLPFLFLHPRQFQQLLHSPNLRCRGLRHKAARMGEVDVGLFVDAGEVVEWVVVVAGEAVAGAAAVGVDEGGDGFVFADGGEITINAGGGFVGEGIGAGDEEDFVVVDGPDLRLLGDVVEAGAEFAQVLEEIGADVAEDFPQGLTGLKALGFGKATQHGDVDGGVELVHGVAVHTKPLGGDVGAAGVEPFSRLQPVAELTGVFIHTEMLQHEAQRAHGRVIGRELMVVEVVALRGVLAADIDDSYRGISEILRGGLAADDGHAMHGGEEAAGEEFVFMRAAGMGEDEGQRHERK